MQANEFEKRVQKQMEELQLRPSDSVWAKVEQELQEKKRRRAVIYFSSIAALLILIFSGYMLWKTTSATNSSHIENNGISNNQSEGTDIPDAADKRGSNTNTATPVTPGNTNIAENKNDNNSNNNNIQPPSVITPSPVQKDALASDKTNNNTTNKNNQYPVRRKQQQQTDELASFESKTPNTAKRKQQNNNNTIPPVTADSAVEKADNAVAIQKDNTDPVNQVIQDNTALTTPDSSKNTNSKDSAVAKTVEQENTEAVVSAPKKNNRKLRIGLDASGGMLFSREKALSLQQERALASPNYGPSGPTTSWGPVIPPSAVRPGPSGRIGVIAELQVSPKSSLISGLRYVYLSENISVGNYMTARFMTNSYQQVTLDVNGAYSAAGVVERPYHNKYHFLELPFLYQLQLGNDKKTQLLWNVGLTADYMIGSNALVYDTAAGGVYYRNKDVYNKFHFNIQTGLFLRFGEVSKLQWSIGPEISMDTRSLVESDAFVKKRYLMYGGITARVLFPSKKK